jgi:hypothetical protein
MISPLYTFVIGYAPLKGVDNITKITGISNKLGHQTNIQEEYSPTNKNKLTFRN